MNGRKPESESAQLTEYGIKMLLVFVLFSSVLVIIGPKIKDSVVLATIFTKHALSSHPEQVDAINECFERGEINGPFTTSNGRMCEYVNDGKNNYWRIFECQGGDKIIITQFKQASNRLVNYMVNHKMKPIPGEPEC